MTCAEPLFALGLCEVLSEMIPSLMWEGYVVFSRVYQEENEAQRGGFCMLRQHVNPGHGAQVHAVWSCTPPLCSHPSNHDHTMNPVLICWRCLPLTPGSACGGISLGSP